MADTKTIQKIYSAPSCSKTLVTLKKVASSSKWMLLKGLWTMEIPLKLPSQFRIWRIRLKGKTKENLMVLRKNLLSKKDVKIKVHLWIHTSKWNNKGAWANAPCKSIFVSYFNYGHFWVLTPSHGSRGPKDNFVFIVREWKWFIKFHCLKISWHFVSIGIVVLITSRKPNLPYQLWIRTHPYITSAYFWTFSDPPNHPTSA